MLIIVMKMIGGKSPNATISLTELQHQLLKTDKGLAIIPTPSTGKLAAYEEMVVELSVYTDMWGQYEDILICAITDHCSHGIPVKVNVTGIPLQFHMAAVTKDPTLRWVVYDILVS